ADVGVVDAAGVRGLAVEARDGVGIVHHRRIHHLDGAAPPHLDVLGEIDLTHAAFAQLLHDVVAIGNDLADQVARGRRRPQRLTIVGTELHVIGIFGGADRTDLHAGMGAAAGSSTRSSLSPTMMREPCCSGIAPRAAMATPLRLGSATRTKSASSERTVACCALIEGSYGKIQSPRSRPM